MAMEMRVAHLFQMYMHVHLNFSQKIKISIFLLTISELSTYFKRNGSYPRPLKCVVFIMVTQHTHTNFF